jgi:hypothetical protein
MAEAVKRYGVDIIVNVQRSEPFVQLASDGLSIEFLREEGSRNSVAR